MRAFGTIAHTYRFVFTNPRLVAPVLFWSGAVGVATYATISSVPVSMPAITAWLPHFTIASSLAALLTSALCIDHILGASMPLRDVLKHWMIGGVYSAGSVSATLGLVFSILAVASIPEAYYGGAATAIRLVSAVISVAVFWAIGSLAVSGIAAIEGVLIAIISFPLLVLYRRWTGRAGHG